ncbi:unnamed protein product [Chilo suppressalis]|uniref:Cuticle protein n=1 Tax=Chilo suppressalis TaxID=168631 RepID=A0ABN8ATV8_CHISP|nr:unnamed protein product [Chilo suppressalis]
MALKVATFFCFVAAAAAGAIPGPVSHLAYAEPEVPAQYEYSYSVQDDHSGDVKQQKENRNGDAVHGFYSLVQPDGTQRIVEYTADKVHGFNAVVRYEGQPHPAPAKIAYAPPQAQVAYAPAPVAKVTYAPAQPQVTYAPAQPQVAYAPAPVTKIAYAPAPVAKVNYAAPIAYANPAPVAYAQAPIPVPVAYPNSAPVAYAHAQHPAYAHAPRVAYPAPLGHVTYSSPAYSYQH